MYTVFFLFVVFVDCSFSASVNEGPDFRKILRQSYVSLRIFVQYTLILRQIYDIP